MLCRSNRSGGSHTRLVVRLTPGSVPTAESEPMNEEIVESSTHEIAQQAPENVLNIG